MKIESEIEYEASAKSENKKKMAFSFVILAAALVLVIAITLAWFDKNREATAEGLGAYQEFMQPRIEYRIFDHRKVPTPGWNDFEPLDGENTLNFGGYLKKPGEKVQIQVKITNDGDQPFTVDSLGFLNAMDYDVVPEDRSLGIEVPVIDGASTKTEAANHADEPGTDVVSHIGNKYYFGTQLYAQLESIQVKTAAAEEKPGDKIFLAEITGGELVAGRVAVYRTKNSVNDDGTKSDSTEEAITLNKDDYMIITFAVHFENLKVQQNMFKSFGAEIPDTDPVQTRGYCSRRLYVECNPAN